MAQSPLRYRKLLQILPKHKSITKAIREAGFSPHTARTGQKRVLAAALKYQLKIIQEANTAIPQSLPPSKRLITDIIGLQKNELLENIKWLVEQQKDLGIRYKLVLAMAKEHGIDLSIVEDKPTAPPMLNLTVENVNLPPEKDGSIEPPIEEAPK